MNVSNQALINMNHFLMNFLSYWCSVRAKSVVLLKKTIREITPVWPFDCLPASRFKTALHGMIDAASRGAANRVHFKNNITGKMYGMLQLQCVKEDAMKGVFSFKRLLDATQQITECFCLRLSRKVAILPARAHSSSSVRFLRGQCRGAAVARSWTCLLPWR